MGGGRYSDSRYSDISKWVLKWVRLELGLGLRSRLGLEIVLGTVGIGSVGIGTCTLCYNAIIAFSSQSDSASNAELHYQTGRGRVKKKVKCAILLLDFRRYWTLGGVLISHSKAMSP